MDVVLIVITVLSLVAALTMALVTWHLVREEGRRSAGRIAALSIQLSEPDAMSEPEGPVPGGRQRRHYTSAQTVGDSSRSNQTPVPADVVATETNDHQAAGTFSGAGPGDLFAITQESSASLRRIGAVAATGVLLLAAVALAVFGLSGSDGVVTETELADASVPVELLSLRHTRTGDTLSIAGFVRNPEHGRAVSQLTAVALLFDRNGSFLGMGSSPLAFSTLKPGAESAFEITVPSGEQVGRYRVSFRRKDETIVPHVDRRADASVNQAESMPDSGV